MPAFSGRLVDEQGRKRYITLGAVLLTASSFSYGLVSDTVLLWPARLAGGAGISLFFTASLAYAGDITPASKRGQMMGYWGMANNLAVALGPLLGVAILKANFLHGFEQELRRWYPGSGSDVGGADLNFATAFLTAGVIGLVCIVLTRRITEVYTPVKQPKVSVLRRLKDTINRKVLLPAWLNLLMVLNFVALNIFVPVYAEELGVANVGLSYYTVFAVFIILSRLFAGPLLDRFPRAYSIVPGFVLMSAATMLIGLVQTSWMLPIGAAMVGLGSGFCNPAFRRCSSTRPAASAWARPRPRLPLASTLASSAAASSWGSSSSWPASGSCTSPPAWRGSRRRRSWRPRRGARRGRQPRAAKRARAAADASRPCRPPWP